MGRLGLETIVSSKGPNPGMEKPRTSPVNAMAAAFLNSLRGIVSHRAGNRLFAFLISPLICLLAKPALSLEPSPTLEWVETVDAFGLSFDVTVDAQGNPIMVGFGLPPGAGLSFRTVKLNSSGDIIWDRTFNGGGDDGAFGVDTDSFGNVYVAGFSRAGPFFLFPTLCRVIKYDPNGNIIWNKLFTRNLQSEICFAVAVDNADDVLVGGELISTCDTAPRFGTCNRDAWIFKLDSAGEKIWDRLVDGSTADTVASDSASRVDTDPDGNVFIAEGGESFLVTANPDGSKTGTAHTFLAKLDPLGESAFIRFLDAEPGVEPPRDAGLAVDALGQALVGGRAGGFPASFRFWRVGPEGQERLRILRPLTASDFGLGTLIIDTHGAATDGEGNFYQSGEIRNGDEDIIAIKMGPDGEELWGVRLVLPGRRDMGAAVAVDADGNVYLAGTTSGGVPFTTNMVLAKFRQAAAPEINLAISLSPAEVRPGKATQVTITATDASGDPVANATITLTAVAVANSGGHDHTANRPVGDFSGPGIVVMSPAAGTTNSSGMLVATYTTTAFGGFETLIAKLTDTPDVSTSATLGVRVPGLVFLPASSLYNKTGGTCDHNGPSATAPVECRTPDRNHFATVASTGALEDIAQRYSDLTDRKLGINDLSLIDGGLFDIAGNWKKPHTLHREGRSADIDRGSEKIDALGQFIVINCEDDEALVSVVEGVTGDAKHLICETRGRKHIEFPNR